jgi:3-dehydroquinate synthase
MNKIHVKLLEKVNRSYDILIENGLLNKIPEILARLGGGEKYAVIADSKVASLIGRDFCRNCAKKGLKTALVTFPFGEKSKSMATVEKLLNKLLQHKISRTDKIIALGGGVTGDIAAFVASIFMRGIPVIHIPTTLLAMVDSSIGGKTGVDLAFGKNLAGTFYQPETVYIDPELISNLPKSELGNGLAEVIKYSIISDSRLFDLLESKRTAILKGDLNMMNKIITRCCQIKASITQRDERENKLRMTLNYGHTVGHAIEKLSNYKISHGHAIVLGMKLINRTAVNLGLLNEKEEMRINKLFTSYGFNDDLKKILKKQDFAKLWNIMQSDKKLRKGKINFIIATGIGKTRIYDAITKADFQQAALTDRTC